MPDVMNCRRCKKIFMHVTGPQICDACKKLEDDDYEKVRTFVKNFPGATIQEVSQETEVPTQLIYRFLKDGRLEVSESSPIALQCENCGIRIKSGRFCVNCSKKLANEMISAGRSLQNSHKPEDDDKDNVGLRYIHGSLRDK